MTERGSQRIGVRQVVRLLALPALVAATLLLACAPALARSPVLQSVKVQNHRATYTWSLPPGVKSRFVETAETAPTTNVFGYFDPQRNVFSFNVASDTDTSLTDDTSFPAGSYYVHVAGEDKSIPDCPRREFSDIFLFVVNSAGDGTGGNIGGGTKQCTSPGGGSGSDKSRPSALLKFTSPQDVDKLFVRARMDEPGSLKATATVSISSSAKVLRFKPITRAVPADRWNKLRLKLRKGALRQVKRALARHKRLKAKVIVVARDRAGNTRTKTATIRLRR
jgi:hypothetical protein